MDRKNTEKRFYELAWPHMDAVLRVAQCLTHSSSDAEDLTQETMVKAFKAINTVRDETHIKGWLMSILRRARIDQVRATRDEASLDQLELNLIRDDGAASHDSEGSSRDPDEVMSSFNDEEIIRELRELPKEIRWTLLLVDVEGMEQFDAAAVLAVPIGTVKSRLHRGRAMLRAALGRCQYARHTPIERLIATGS
jgi:RNA polymerase sigma-70 factor (ECF subfamily)